MQSHWSRGVDGVLYSKLDKSEDKGSKKVSIIKSNDIC